jgi:hypothetical protein
MEWLGFRYCIGVSVEGVFLVFLLPSSTVWISESWFLPAFLKASGPCWRYIFVSFCSHENGGVCLYISVGVFVFFPLSQAEDIHDFCNQPIQFLLVCTSFFSFRLLRFSSLLYSALPYQLNILISFAHRTEINPTYLLVCKMVFLALLIHVQRTNVIRTSILGIVILLVYVNVSLPHSFRTVMCF